MSEIREYFDGISSEKSHEQISREVIARAKAERGSKKRGLKPFAAIAAAAVVMVAGVTAAAATGLLNINAIFGGRISAQDEALAGELVIAAEDFSWSVSDDDYMIELKGVTGSKSDMLLAYEIKRVDGKPVTDYMTNIPEDGALTAKYWSECSAEDGMTKLGVPLERGISTVSYNMQCSMTDTGNIEVYYRMTTDGDISDTTLTIDSLNLYPKAVLQEFEKQNDMYLSYPAGINTPVGFYGWGDGSIYDGKPLDIAINDERIIGLELEWMVQLSYNPNETAIQTKQMDADTVKLYYTRYSGVGNTEFTLLESEFSCVSGRLELTRTGSMLNGSVTEEYNEVYLITDSEEHIPCTVVMQAQSYDHIEMTEDHVVDVHYSETLDAPITAIDISEITAISINGETFPLA